MAQPNQIKEYTGTLVRWIHTYGFISIDENDEYDTGMNVFVHISQIKHQLNESDPVTFKIVVQSDGRLRAIDVSLLDTPGCESEVVWQFCENNDSWIDMNNIVSKKIEFAKENIIIPVQIGKWMYKIVKLDTTTGYQINTTTGTKRNIRKSGESEKISVQLFEEEKEIVSHRIIVGLPDYKTQKIHADTMEKINTEKKEIKTKLHDQCDENGYKTIAIIVCIIVASAVILCGYLLLQHASKIRKKQATESDYSDRPFVILAGFIFILSSICGCVSICFCATCIGTLCNDCSDMSHSCYEICYTIPKQEREELKEMRNRYYFNAWKRMIKTDQLDYYINEEFEDEFEGKNEEKCEEEKESKYDTEWNWQDDDETFQPFAKDINSHIATVAVSSISHYKIGKWSYVFYKLSDTVGIQMNEETLKCRLTHCTNWSDDDVGLTDCLAKNIIKFPDIWKNKTNKLQFYPLDMNGRLFADIAKLFYCNEEFDDLDVSTSMVLKIESLQNKFLWKSYVGIRKAHASIIGESNLNERYLWHGTSTDAVQNICSTGFLRDYGETMRYGNGVYFAKNAAFSTEYTKPDSNGLRQMILARVLLGESCQGQESYNVPPLKPNSNVPFESMVDELNGDAEIFVISKDYQVYPEFVVTFKFI